MLVSPFIRAAKGEDGPELWITGEIGVDVRFADLQRALSHYAEENTGTFILNIYSHGGMLDDVTAFYDWVNATGTKFKVRIWGTAMSAATVIAAAAGRENIEIASNATWMIHRAWGGTDEMNDLGNEALVRIYRKLTGMSAAKITEMMTATTTLSAQEAVDMGFAGKVMKATMKLAAMHEARAIELNEKPKRMKVKAHVKLSAVDAIKATTGGVDVEVEVEPSEQEAALKEIADQATKDRQAAEAKATEDGAALKALKDRETDALAKLAEAQAAKKLAETATAEVTAKLTTATTQAAAQDAVIVALKADVAKLKKLPTAKAIALSAEGTAVEPGEGGTITPVGGPTDQEQRMRRIAEEMKQKSAKK